MSRDSLSSDHALFWGMPGEFSRLALEALLQAGASIAAVILPAGMGTPQEAPIQRLEPEASVSPLQLSRPYMQRTTAHVAWEAGLPVWQVRQLAAAETAEWAASFKPSVALVACFPWRIPQALLEIPTHGFLNLHPSLLPDLRGPYPLFWTFRLGIGMAGVTVHQMDGRFDRGPLALQRAIYLPDGISGAATDHLLGRQGGGMLALAAQKLAEGSLSLQPQGEGGRTFPRPGRADFTVPTTWSARHAFNFMRGTAEWHHAYHVKGEEVDLHVRQALQYDQKAKVETPVTRDGRDVWIQFAEGALHAR